MRAAMATPFDRHRLRLAGSGVLDGIQWRFFDGLHPVAADPGAVGQRLEIDWPDGEHGAVESIDAPLAGPADYRLLATVHEDRGAFVVLRCPNSIVGVDAEFGASKESGSLSPMFDSNVGDRLVIVLAPLDQPTARITLRGTDLQIVARDNVTISGAG
jgi:hypothetical protein